MALRPDEFYAHAVSAADDERRLPLARMTGWEISPFEPDGLRVSPLHPPVLPEPPRHGEDPADCNACRKRDEGIWLNDRWRLVRIPRVGVPLVLMLHPRDHHDLADLPDELAAELGLLTTRIARHVQALPGISRPRLPLRRRRRAPAHLVLRPAGGPGPALRLVAGRLGRPPAGISGGRGRRGRRGRGGRAGRLARRPTNAHR
jgi:hypothetical protein